MQLAPELEATWVRLREAGRALAARSLDARLDAPARLLDEFSRPDSEIHRRLASELPDATGFHPATTRAGLELALAEWTGKALRSLAERELGTDPSCLTRGFESTAVVLGGALPMPTLLSLVAPLAVGSPVLARSGRHDPLTSRCVADGLNALDPQVGACLALTDFPHGADDAWRVLLGADCVVATGSDETLAEIASRVAPGTRFVGYGHRLSVAVIGAEADAAQAADALALDVALWDQLGCLSPVAVWVLAPDGEVPASLEAELERAFGEVGKRLPRGATPAEARARLAQERDGAEFRAASNERVRLHTGEGWTLVIEPSPSMGPAPLHRFLRVHPVRDLAALQDCLMPLAPRLAAVGMAAGPDETARIVAALQPCAPSRITPLGRMQAPPLAWHHDGQGVLWPLVRFTDIEL